MIRYTIHTLQRSMALAAVFMLSLAALAQNSESKSYFVVPNGYSVPDTANAVWKTSTTLSDAVSNAVEGDKIYLLGFEKPTKDQVYRVPSKSPNISVGFTLKAGVHISGGYAPYQDPQKGTAQRITEQDCAAYFKYRSVVSADVSGDDLTPDAELGLAGTDIGRSDNAREVFVVDLAYTTTNKGLRTEIDGLVIEGGSAISSGTNPANNNGGGIILYNAGAAFTIANCVFYNNYARNLGGAVYVAPSVNAALSARSYIYNCVAFNNQAGALDELANNGAGFYIAGGDVTVYNSVIHNNRGGGLVLADQAKAVNVTVAMNSTAGIDGVVDKAKVCNSVIWNNDRLFFAEAPTFYNSAFHETSSYPDHDNVYIGRLVANEKEASPFFVYSAVNHGFDLSYYLYGGREYGYAYHYANWGITDRSALKDKGNNVHISAGNIGQTVDKDLAGSDRISEKGGTVDIGACELYVLPSGGDDSRVFYVRQKSHGTGSGTSWDNATDDLQAAINKAGDLVKTNGGRAEVWVAEGVYTPKDYIVTNSRATEGRVLSFYMREGVSVFGGFDEDNPETTKVRQKDATIPWRYTNETVLAGAGYLDDTNPSTSKYQSDGNIFTGSSSASTHVIWFAPRKGEAAFSSEIVLEGVTVRGGKSSGTSAADDYYREDCGAGIFAGKNARIVNCVVTECEGTTAGAGVYLDGGIIESSLVANCGPNATNNALKGGGVYVDNSGLVAKSMITNCAADRGAAVYMANDGSAIPAELILSTSVISNNTVNKNGAVYTDRGGVVLQSTIVNNVSRGTTDDSSSGTTTQTGGLYVNSYGKVYNCLLWNNSHGNGDRVQTYISNPSRENTQFIHSAFSDFSLIHWNNTLQYSLRELHTDNSGSDDDASKLYPNFTAAGMPSATGVLPAVGYQDIVYIWAPVSGSDMRRKGMSYHDFDADIVFSPELDMTGTPFSSIPPFGAIHVDHGAFKPAEIGGNYVLFVDPMSRNIGHKGSSWDDAISSFTDALSYMSEIETKPDGIDTLEIRLMEGTYEPGGDFVGTDTRFASANVKPCVLPLKIVGGYSRSGKAAGVRNPVEYRSILDANRTLTEDAAYFHCMKIHTGADVTIDGLCIVNANAMGSVDKYGAGISVAGDADITLRNVVIENCRAVSMAAIAAPAAAVRMYNCVVNNNTCTHNDGRWAVGALSLRLEHCSFINNRSSAFYTPSVDAINSYGYNNALRIEAEYNGFEDFASAGRDELIAAFVNPSLNVGDSLARVTYLGGYPVFRPLTSSPFAGDKIINHGEPTTLTHDISLSERNLGGTPDLGAYEAVLPDSGSVYYVKVGGTGTGLSWADPLGSIQTAVNNAYDVVLKTGKHPQVWVAAGTYTENVTMREGVDVLGGFAATGAPSNILDGKNRDLSHKKDEFKTTIDGKDGRFGRNNVDFDKMSQRVLTQPNNFSTKTTWEGFVITGALTAIDKWGAGVYLMNNGVIKNCLVTGNRYVSYGNVRRWEQTYDRLWGWRPANANAASEEDLISAAGGGGGVYCATGGLVENCQIIGNTMSCDADANWNVTIEENRRWHYETYNNGQVFARGAGLYIEGGSVINTVIAQNTIGYFPLLGKQDDTEFTNILGAGVYANTASYFYNCTIVENGGGWSNPTSNCGNNKDRSTPGLWDQTLESTLYNCIVAGNVGYGNSKENFYQVGKGLSGVPEKMMYTYFSYIENIVGNCGGDGTNTAPEAKDESRHNIWNDDLSTLAYNDQQNFWNVYKNTHKLLDDQFYIIVDDRDGGNPLLNSGYEGYVNGENDAPLIEQDADGYDRIQDCAVDLGAYEKANKENIAYKESTADDGKTYRMYYVTHGGSGLSNGSSPDNAACAMKLQDVLHAAGGEVAADVYPIVKVAMGNYVATEAADKNDPRSYTFTIPYGVTLMGGYKEDFTVPAEGGDTARDAYAAKTVLTNVRTVNKETVESYHVLTFDSAAAGAPEKRYAIVDGIFIQGGNADAAVGNKNSLGGGAIVPAWAHIRNCVVSGCNASADGGGLYLYPGATVSGTLLRDNYATRGGAVYANGNDSSARRRARMISCTVVNNEATEGGGIMFEEGALMMANSVIYSNTAMADRQISGNADGVYKDSLWSYMVSLELNQEPDYNAKYHPFANVATEKLELPASFGINLSLTSDTAGYFTNLHDAELTTYSPLVKSGAIAKFQEVMQGDKVRFRVSPYDMRGVSRLQMRGSQPQRLDIGYAAYEGGQMQVPNKADSIVDIIFVKHIVDREAGDNTIDDPDGAYLGKSFVTPLVSLNRALAYIDHLRNHIDNNDIKEKAIETDFVILLTDDTYKPSERRLVPNTPGFDLRQNSFTIPAGVSIYGGFQGDETMNSRYISCKFGGATDGNVSVGGKDFHNITKGDLQTLLDGRARTDINGNGVIEPYEFVNKSIISGHMDVSDDAVKAYHVLYSDSEGQNASLNDRRVVLDGLTIKDGLTAAQAGDKEVGKGAAIYTNGVDYEVRLCRFSDNMAVKGNAIAAEEASVRIYGSSFAGNGAVQGAESPTGGAIYGYTSGNDSITALNTIFANNGSSGAVIATEGNGYRVKLTNCNIVRNKAKGALIAANDIAVTNTVMWGNTPDIQPAANGTLRNSASDVTGGAFASGKNGNIQIGTSNDAVDGPRFVSAPDEIGVDGYSLEGNKWNPASISVLVDNGDGTLSREGNTESGAYLSALKEWMPNATDKRPVYMKDANNKELERYIGRPMIEGETSENNPHRIDIGVYEYQYQLTMSDLDTVYVDLEDQGKADGSSWGNATSSLDAAIRALSNPTGSVGSQKTKYIFVRSGEYSFMPLLENGNALVLNNKKYSDDGSSLLDSLIIKGSYNENGVRDFSNPTILTVNSAKVAGQLMSINTKGVDVILEGLRFEVKGDNAKKVDGISIAAGKADKDAESDPDGRGNVTLKNVSFIGLDEAVTYSSSDSKSALMANVLFAKNTVALTTTTPEALTVVNATFAENGNVVPENATLTSVYNSVFWKTGHTGVTISGNDGNKNLDDAANDNILEGPNFVNPDAGDYNIRPSQKLLNTGVDALYYEKVMGAGTPSDDAKNAEYSLSNSTRFVGTIDVGAYEYESELRDVLYVKAGVASGDGSGSDWDNAMSDLQTAADHAALYAMTEKKKATVYVHQNVDEQALSVKSGGVYIYGTMNDADNDTVLADRGGVLLAGERSSISSLTMNNSGDGGKAIVVDGFEMTGENIEIKGAGEGAKVLSTSLINGKVTLTNAALYNSLVTGEVEGSAAATDVTEVVNVTATGTVADGIKSKSYSTISEAQPVGYIISDYWKYQLNDTASLHINKGDNGKTTEYVGIVGHSRDISGAPRFIDGSVDFGAFETWNITDKAGVEVDTTLNSKEGTIPTDRHVVYVREGAELELALTEQNGLMFTSAKPFTPGYLLLEHAAELLGRGNYINLTNFAMERNLQGGAIDLVSVPFSVSKFEIERQEYEWWDGKYDNKVNIMFYDGWERAKYDYRMDSSAWKPITAKQEHTVLDGLLVENLLNKEITIRMTGETYTEGDEMAIELQRYMYFEPWTGTTTTGNRFTHKENMSWNLIGSPYLCTMNYEDMEYGRVIYQQKDKTFGKVDNLPTDGSKQYQVTNTSLRGVSGFVPVGTAVFTQTATLIDKERVTISPRGKEIAEVQYALDHIAVAIRREEGGRASYAPAADDNDDVITLSAVPTEESRTDYDIARDGVKMAALDSLATEIYMMRYGRRYSLLTDLDIEGTVKVGVSVGTKGSYLIYIPGYADRTGYDVVALHDALTGRVVDLLETDYSFAVAEAGEINDRFTITFRHTETDITGGAEVYTPERGVLVVDKLDVMKESTIRIYDAKGMMVAWRSGYFQTETFALPGGAAYLIEITSPDTDTVVLKAIVR